MDAATPLFDTPDQSINEVTAHHEAGHAVMARLFGIGVTSIKLYLNIQGTYNGETAWERGRHPASRVWDPNIPYNKLVIRQGEKANEDEALVYAAGKAAERIWYRQRSMDETQASYGSGVDSDERQLEEELAPPPDLSRLIPVDLTKRIQGIEHIAMRLLGEEVCWQAVEAVAQAILEGLKQTPNSFMLEDVQNRVAEVFAQAVLNKKV